MLFDFKMNFRLREKGAEFYNFSFFSPISWTLFFCCLIFLINSYSLLPVAAFGLKTWALQTWPQNIFLKEHTAVGWAALKQILNRRVFPTQSLTGQFSTIFLFSGPFAMFPPPQ